MGRSKILKGSLILTGGRMASFGLSFARNIILARLLTKADFGLVALFSTTVALLEVSARMSFGQQIVQSKHGDSVDFQASAHCFQFLLSLVGAILLVLASYPLAQLFKLPNLMLAFASLAIVPLARGLEHLDYYRQQRELNYMPGMLCELIPQAIVTLAAWPLVLWLKDFRAILWLIVGKAVGGIFVSHFLAQRKYRWTWNAEHMRFMWSFGWPLLINGLLMFACQQADQTLVGARFSLEILAVYSLACSIVAVPWSIFAQVGTSLVLPVMSKVQGDVERFKKQYRICVECGAAVAVCIMLPLIIAGEKLVVGFYGAKYAGAGSIVAIVGASFTIRFLRFTPAIAAMAKGDTLNQLYSNLWRGVSLPLMLLVSLVSSNILLIACCGLFAELVAAVVSLVRLRKQGVPFRDSVKALIYVATFVAGGVAAAMSGATGPTVIGSVLAVVTSLILALLTARWALPVAFEAMQSAIATAASGAKRRFSSAPIVP